MLCAKAECVQMLNIECGMLCVDAECWMQNAECCVRLVNVACRMLNVGCSVGFGVL